MNVTVVGAGLFGLIMAQHLRSQGVTVRHISEDRPGNGSAPAGCLMKPTWLSSMSKVEIKESFDLLDKHYGIRDIDFNVFGKIGPMMTLQHVSPAKIRSLGQAEQASVFRHSRSQLMIEPEGDIPYSIPPTEPVIACLGIWAGELDATIDVSPRCGWSFRSSEVPPVNILKPWAPYKQLIAFTMDGGGWAGDGSALIPRSATEQRRILSQERCATVLPGTLHCTGGARPYARTDGKPALIRRDGQLISVTGGGKNGTAAAAWAALRVGEMLGL